MAGISSSGAGAVPLLMLAAPPEYWGVPGHGSYNHSNNTLSPLLDLLERFPDLFALKVLGHLDPIDRTFLAQAGGACRAAVAASDLPRAGTREEVLGKSVWVVTHRLRELCTSVERLAWAKASGCPWVAHICALAAEGGRLEVLRWARSHGCPWDTRTFASAAVHGHLEVLDWAQAHGCPWQKNNTCSHAAKGGHVHVLQWAILEHDCPWSDITCFCAAQNGNLAVLRWLREHGCPWDKSECEVASRRHPETLAWVRAQSDEYEDEYQEDEYYEDYEDYE